MKSDMFFIRLSKFGASRCRVAATKMHLGRGAHVAFGHTTYGGFRYLAVRFARLMPLVKGRLLNDQPIAIYQIRGSGPVRPCHPEGSGWIPRGTSE